MMKLTINSGDLKAAATDVARVLNNKNSMPILDCFRMEATSGNRMEIRASDGEFTAVKTVGVVNIEGEPGAFCLNARTLLDALRNIPGQPITASVGYGAAKFDYGRGKFEMPCQGADEYPEPPELKEAPDMAEMPCATLLNALTRASCCVADDEIHPVMNGVYMDISEDGVSLAATDGHKLCHIRLTEVGGGEKSGVIIPKKAVLTVKALLPKTEDTVAVLFDGRNIRVDAPNFTLHARCIDGRYPNYNSVIPRGSTKTAKVERAAAISALRRVFAFASKTSAMVKLSFAPFTGLDISAQDIDFSTSARENVPLESYEGAELTIGFKGAFLIELLQCCLDGAEHVTFGMSEPSRAGVFTAPEPTPGLEVTALLMPMNIVE